MKLFIAALLSVSAAVSFNASVSKAETTLATAAIAQKNSRVVVNLGGYLSPNWKVGKVSTVFSDGRASVRFQYQDDDKVVSLRGAGVGVKCLYNDQVCEGHEIAFGDHIGRISEVFSNGQVAIRLMYQDEDKIVSLKDIGIQADCAVISCEIKLK